MDGRDGVCLRRPYGRLHPIAPHRRDFRTSLGLVQKPLLRTCRKLYARVDAGAVRHKVSPAPAVAGHLLRVQFPVACPVASALSVILSCLYLTQCSGLDRLRSPLENWIEGKGYPERRGQVRNSSGTICRPLSRSDCLCPSAYFPANISFINFANARSKR